MSCSHLHFYALRESISLATSETFMRLLLWYSLVASDCSDIKSILCFSYSLAMAAPLVPPKKSMYSCSGKFTLSFLWGCENFVGSHLSSSYHESERKLIPWAQVLSLRSE